MGDSAEKLATYEDLLAAPPHLIAEIIHGRLVTHPRPAPRHINAASSLGMILGPPFRRGVGGPGGWVILDEPELHLGAEIVVPDLAGWRRERMPRLPETAWFETGPDWTCEFISRSSTSDDRRRKPGIYASFGVAYYWLGDPVERTLQTFELTEGIWERTGGFRDDDRIAAPPFAEGPFPLGELWAE